MCAHVCTAMPRVHVNHTTKQKSTRGQHSLVNPFNLMPTHTQHSPVTPMPTPYQVNSILLSARPCPLRTWEVKRYDDEAGVVVAEGEVGRVGHADGEQALVADGGQRQYSDRDLAGNAKGVEDGEPGVAQPEQQPRNEPSLLWRAVDGASGIESGV